eukprot:scaffold57459_cov14-Tisochrysis_lutea.AAC.1
MPLACALVKIKHHKDTRPEQQLEAAHQLQEDLCGNISGRFVSHHFGGTCYTETIYQSKELAWRRQLSTKKQAF